jgi:amino acid permease
MSESGWKKLAEIGWVIFAVVVAIVLFVWNISNLSNAALLSVGSFVGLSIIGYILFEKVLDKLLDKL